MTVKNQVEVFIEPVNDVDDVFSSRVRSKIVKHCLCLFMVIQASDDRVLCVSSRFVSQNESLVREQTIFHGTSSVMSRRLR
jgi:hypothetical protein